MCVGHKSRHAKLFVLGVTVGTCDVQESDKLASVGLHICHEDDDIVFTPTPAGSYGVEHRSRCLTCHRGHRQQRGCLAVLVLHHFPTSHKTHEPQLALHHHPTEKAQASFHHGSAAWAAATGVLPL